MPHTSLEDTSGDAAQAAGGEGSSRRLDPTRMRNQPSLRTSNGAVWLVVGGLFAAVSLIPFAMLIFAGSVRSRDAAITIAVIVVALYGAMLVARFAIAPGVKRLSVLAGGMLTMAAVALIGVWLCLLIERAAG